jgi:hypothetical protein
MNTITIKCPYTDNDITVEYEVDTDEYPVSMNPVTDSIKYETSKPYILIESINGLISECYSSVYLEEVSKIIADKVLNND